MTKKLLKHKVVDAPRNGKQATQLLSEIGRVKRSIETIQTTLNEQIENLKKKALSEAAPLQEKLSGLVEALYVFAEGNRETITDGGKRRTVFLPTGSFGWRTTPPAVHISNNTKVLARLEELGLVRFIRIKKEPDKEAMLKELELAGSIRGVSITQKEEFFVKPSSLDIGLDIPEIVSDAEKLKKAIG